MLGIALFAGASAAQEQAGVRVVTGFTPDPLRFTGRTSGEAALGGRAPGCRGYVGGAPDHVVRLDTRFGFLRFFVVAPGEVTLALHGPDGRWHCAGRPLDGAPREQGTFEPGIYEVWIGSQRQRQQIAYELHVTEFQSVGPATGRSDEPILVGGGAEIGLQLDATDGRFADRRFRRGFIPDPASNEGEAGGSIDAALLGGGCRGRVEPQPSHTLTLRTEFDYFRIQLAAPPGQVTLIVRTPDGRYLCSSPDEGEPFVDAASWDEGNYLIWVGSRTPGTAPQYRILYSEMRPRQ